jgi:hypothetical protein
MISGSGNYYKAILVNSGGKLVGYGSEFRVETNLLAGASAGLRHNDFIGINFNIDGDSDPQVDIRYNNFSAIAPGKVVLGNSSVTTYDLQSNYWGTEDGPTIDALIIDDEETNGAAPAADFSSPIALGALGHQVWNDLDHDGIHDITEPGVDGITVELHDAGDNSILATTTTTNGGFYTLATSPGVPYYLTFTLSDTQRQIFAPANATNNFQDSDADTVTGRTDNFSVAGNGYDFHEDAGLWISNPPVIGGLAPVNYQENQAPLSIAPSATLSDSDSPNFGAGRLLATITAGGEATDALTIAAVGGITVSGNTVKYNNTTIATFTGGGGTTPLGIALQATATPTNVQALLRAISYSSSSNNPGTTPRTIQLVLKDGDGGTSTAVNATVNVSRLNDAPVLNTSLSPVLAAVVEDATNPPGTVISNLLNGAYSDPDNSNLRGIAVVGTTGSGTWQYSLNSGASWNAIGTVSDSSARLIPAAAKVRFLPAHDFNGQVQFSYRAWDQTQGNAGALFNLTGKLGGTNAFSTGKENAPLNVIPVNDAPVLNTAPNPTLAAIVEDATNPPGTLVSGLVATAATDVDAGALKGIAVIAAGGLAVGHWQFTTNGGTTWQELGAPSESSARLLAADANTRIRFIPNANFNGDVKLYYRAWDQTAGAAGGTLSTANNVGGTKTFSSAFENATLTVSPVDDKPVLNVTNSSAVGYALNSAPGVNFMTSAATVTDIDSPNFDTGVLLVSITAGKQTGNRVDISGNFSWTGDDLFFNQTTKIGTRNSGGGVGTTDLSITFTANATLDLVQRLVRTLRFSTVGGTAGQRTIAVSVSDGDGATSAVVNRTVNVT